MCNLQVKPVDAIPSKIHRESLLNLQEIPLKLTMMNSVQNICVQPCAKLQGKPVGAVPCRINRESL